MRILVVDDDRRLCVVIKRGLLEEAYAVDVAYGGEEGECLAEANLTSMRDISTFRITKKAMFQVLVDNPELEEGEEVELDNNPLRPYSINIYMSGIEAKGLTVCHQRSGDSRATTIFLREKLRNYLKCHLIIH